MRGKYVYCVIQSADPLKFGAAGIGDNGMEIHTVHYRDLAAEPALFQVALVVFLRP